MRVSFSDVARPKAAAKQLSRLSPDVTLARAQEALARGAGYRDWHELVSSITGQIASDFNIHSLVDFVAKVSDALGLPHGDVQFAMSKARIVGSIPWALIDQITLNMAIVRATVLGLSARRKPGTIVKIRAHGETRFAYLIRAGRPTHVLYDNGEGICADFEAVTPRTAIVDFLPARLWLPYGVWTLDDGSEVVFARDYLPLWRIASSGVERLDPWLWIKSIKSQRWFAANTEGDWWRPAGRLPALAYLEKHRIFELPKLANAMSYMFAPDVETIEDSVRRLYDHAFNDLVIPGFAVLNSNLLRK